MRAIIISPVQLLLDGTYSLIPRYTIFVGSFHHLRFMLYHQVLIVEGYKNRKEIIIHGE